MKKFYLLLASVVICGIGISQNKVVEIKKTASPIVIDGEEDAVWTQADTINIWYWGKDKTAPSDLDFKAYFRLLWDDNYFYFIGYIEDDDLMTQERAAELDLQDWEVDCWELYWAPGNSKEANASGMIQVRLAYANKGSSDPTASTTGGWSPGNFMNGIEFVNAVMNDLGSGYIIEAALDLAKSAEALDIEKIGAGDTVGFNALANDIDADQTNRENIGGPISGTQWDQADTLMRVVLSSTVISSINNLVNKTIFKVYPNPVGNELRFTANTSIVSIEIYSIEGKLVLKAMNPSSGISVAILPSGLYTIKAITNSGNIITQKIIKK